MMKMQPNPNIDKDNPPSHLRQIDTGRIYVYTAVLAKRADMEPYAVPKKVEEIVVKQEAPVEPVVYDLPEVAEPDSSPEVEMAPEDRKAIIKGAAALIDRDQWIKGTTAWPTSPAALDIEAIVGFKVSRREIIDAIKE